MQPEYRYLDGEAERRILVRDMRAVRQLAAQIAGDIPADRHYEPRYHGWSLAALLAHLHTVDAYGLWIIRFALIGFSVPLSMSMINRFNDLTAGVYRRRVVATTLSGIDKNADKIADFIMTVPMERFSKQVYHPPSAGFLTVEKALQQYFLFHWQEHLDTVRAVEGISYQPPTRSAEE